MEIERLGADPDLATAIRRSPLAVAIVDLDTTRFVAISDRFLETLGLEPDTDVTQIGVLSVVADPAEGVGDALRLLSEGQLTGYEARRHLRRADGTVVERTVWVRVVGRARGRRVAAVVAGETGEDGLVDIQNGFGGAALVRRNPIAVGTVDQNWRISRVSADVEALLGHSPEECIGEPVLTAVHPADVPTLFAVVNQAASTHRAAGVRIRVADADNRWRPLQVVVTYLDGGVDVPRFGFAAAAATEDEAAPSATERVAALEQTLWRIALELESAGVVHGIERLPDASSLPALRDLTARQWEILTRLLRGERVPGIARAMYLSASTVRNHLSMIFRKVGVHSQEELLDLLREQNQKSVQSP